jgi:hypothetical protein
MHLAKILSKGFFVVLAMFIASLCVLRSYQNEISRLQAKLREANSRPERVSTPAETKRIPDWKEEVSSHPVQTVSAEPEPSEAVLKAKTTIYVQERSKKLFSELERIMGVKRAFIKEFGKEQFHQAIVDTIVDTIGLTGPRRRDFVACIGNYLTEKEAINKKSRDVTGQIADAASKAAKLRDGRIDRQVWQRVYNSKKHLIRAVRGELNRLRKRTANSLKIYLKDLPEKKRKLGEKVIDHLFFKWWASPLR